MALGSSGGSCRVSQPPRAPRVLAFVCCIQARNSPYERNPTVAGRLTAPSLRIRRPCQAGDPDRLPSEASPFVFDHPGAGERQRRGLGFRQWGIRQVNNMPESMIRRLIHTDVSCRRLKRPKGESNAKQETVIPQTTERNEARCPGAGKTRGATCTEGVEAAGNSGVSASAGAGR